MIRLGAGFAALTLGTFLSFSDAFLATWTAAARGRHDIAARGPFLLALFAPYFTAAVALVVIGVAVYAARRQRSFAKRIAVLSVATIAIAFVIVMIDHSATMWLVLRDLRGRFGAGGYVVGDITRCSRGRAWLFAHREPRSGFQRMPSLTNIESTAQ